MRGLGNKSIVAQHIQDTAHPITCNNLKLIKAVSNNTELSGY